MLSESAPPPLMLLAEPDDAMASRILEAAHQRGVYAEWCGDGAEALVALGAARPDVLVIAARTSTIAVSKVIEIVRRCWPIRILVGAGPEDADHARRALDAGASAVVARPYEIDSIFAMGLGLTPRRPPPNDLQAEEDTLIAGPITIDLRGHEARVRGREVRLTHRELELLAYLIRQRGRVANQDEITAAVWGHPADTNTVAVHIKRLRDKLGLDPERGQMIRTVRGAGYRLTPSLCTDAESTAS